MLPNPSNCKYQEMFILALWFLCSPSAFVYFLITWSRPQNVLCVWRQPPCLFDFQLPSYCISEIVHSFLITIFTLIMCSLRHTELTKHVDACLWFYFTEASWDVFFFVVNIDEYVIDWDTLSSPLPRAIPCPIRLREGMTTRLPGGEFNQSIYN